MRRTLALTAALSAVLLLSGCKNAEEKAEEYFQSAITLIEEGDPERAIVELRNVLENDGSHREARRLLAEQLLSQRGNPQRAYAQYLRLVEQYPDDLDGRIRLAEMAFDAGNWEELERHGAAAADIMPDDPRVRAITIGRAYREAALAEDAAARRDEARAASELLSDLSDNILLRSVVIDSHLQDGEFGLALDEVDKLIENRPDNRGYWQQKLLIVAQMGDPKAVEALLFEIVDRFPEEDEYKATLIRYLLSQNDLDGAEAYLRQRVAGTTDPGPRVDLIRFLDEVRGTQAAQAEIEIAIAEADDPVPFQVMGAVLDFSNGDQDEAIATLEGILSATSDDDDDAELAENVAVSLARMLLVTGNEVGARARVEEVLASNPGHAEALKMQAAWQIRADDTDGAISSLRLALDSAPEDADAMSLMAEAYNRAGSPNLERDFLALAVEASGNGPVESLRYAQLLIREERYLPAEDVLLPALRLAPQNEELLAALGQLYLRMDDMGRVQQVADTLRRVGTPEGVSAADALEAERLNRQAGPDEAIAYLESIAEQQDASLGSQVMLVRARLVSRDFEGALELARRLAADSPDNAELAFVLASTEAVNGNLDTAEAIYRNLVSDNPQAPAVWMELVRVAHRKDGPDAAMALIDEGLGQLPGESSLLWAKASFLEQRGDIDGSIAIYEELYEQDSTSLVVANNLASLLSTWRTDDASLERAWVIARRFSAIEVPAMQDTYGWITFRRGEPETALPYLEAAAEGLSQDPVVQYHLGRAYEELDRLVEARTQYANAAEIGGPGDTRPQLEDARSRLRAIDAAVTSDQ